MLLEIAEQDVQVRGHDLQDGGAVGRDGVDQPPRVKNLVGGQDERPAAHRERRDQLPERDVE